MVGGGQPLLPEILGQPAPVGAKLPILNIFSRSASAVTPSKKNSIKALKSLKGGWKCKMPISV